MTHDEQSLMLLQAAELVMLLLENGHPADREITREDFERALALREEKRQGEQPGEGFEDTP